MRGKRKKVELFLVVLMLGLSSFFVCDQVQAALKLNKSSLLLLKGKSAVIKLKGTDKTVKWRSSNRRVASVKNGKVTGKKKGTAVITAAAGGERLKCKVRVVEQYSRKDIDEHLSRFLEKHYDEWKLVFFEGETWQEGGKYVYWIRYQGGNTANIDAGLLYVDPLTGEAVLEPGWALAGTDETVWKIF